MLRKIFLILILGPVLLVAAVLLFHVIAIGGVYALNKHQAETADYSVAPPSPPAPASGIARVAPATPAPARLAEPAPVSTRTYIVKKGDNPAAIARSFGVSSTDLLVLNQIEDPRKLRIGAVLKLPPAKSHAP